MAFRLASGNKEEVDMSALSEGIYLLQIYSENYKISGKIIKN